MCIWTLLVPLSRGNSILVDLSWFVTEYTDKDEERAHEQGFASFNHTSTWSMTSHGLVINLVLEHLHEVPYQSPCIYILKGHYRYRIAQRITQGFHSCTKNNFKSNSYSKVTSVQPLCISPFQEWDVDFTQMPPNTGNYKYVLVLWVPPNHEWRHSPLKTKKT